MNIPHQQLLEGICHKTNCHPFSLHHTIVAPNEHTLLYLHWHDELEFLYLTEGQAHFFIEDQEYFLQAGEGLFIPPHSLHRGTRVAEGPVAFYALVCSSQLLSFTAMPFLYQHYLAPLTYPNPHAPLHLAPTIAWQKDLLTHLTSIFNKKEVPLKEWDLQFHGTFLILWQLLYNHHLSQYAPPSTFNKLNLQLMPAIDYIHQHYDEDVTLSQLAHIVHLSTSQFCRSFKQLTYTTPFNYLNRYRIMKSCDLLTHSTKKITDIASASGYNNISYFNREFVKIMKVTPSCYRKQSDFI